MMHHGDLQCHVADLRLLSTKNCAREQGVNDTEMSQLQTTDKPMTSVIMPPLLQQGISEPIFYDELLYKFKRIVGKPTFIYQFKKIVKRYIRVGYNLDVMRQSACLVLIPNTVYSYGFLFNCTTVDQAPDSMTALT